MTSEEFDEDALKRALRAPGSPTELAGEQTYRAMFRAAQPPTEVVLPTVLIPTTAGRSAVRRLGTGTTLAVVVAMATGGVAAAYSSNLPDPVQRAVHSVLSPLGVPAVEPKRHVVEARDRQTPEPEAPTPSVAPPAVPSSSPSADPSHEPYPTKTTEASPSTDPSASETPALPSETPTDLPSSTTSADPSTSPSPSETPSPTTSPTTSPTSSPTTSPPPTPIPATVSITSVGADSKVAPGGTAVVTGRVVTADGTPVSDVRVFLKQLGASGWQRVGSARTGADGSVAVATGPVQRSTRVRFRTGKARSAPWNLVVQPSVTATAQTVGRVSSVTVGVNGAQPGDQVLLVTTRSGQVVQEGAASLTASGAVRFEITAPSTDHWYAVQLPATAGHAAAQVRVLVKAALPDQP